MSIKEKISSLVDTITDKTQLKLYLESLMYDELANAYKEMRETLEGKTT
jgi:hypothetical protein